MPYLGKSPPETPAVQNNIIINGDHRVDQRLGDTRTGIDDGSGAFLSDRWQVVANGSASARWTGSIETTNGPAVGDRWLKLICTTPDSSPGANEMAWVRQGVEGSNCVSLIDPANGKIGAFTVSGKIIAYSASSFPLKVAMTVWTDDGTARQYTSDISVAAASTWQDFEVNVSADATGSFVLDNGSGMRVGFALYGGSGRQATENTWANYNGDCVTSNTHNWAAATNEYLGFTNCKVEPGSSKSSFIHDDYSVSLAKCQRYYVRWSTASGIGMAGVCRSTTSGVASGLNFPVSMRAAPTMTWGTANVIDSSAGGVDGTPATNVAGLSGVTATFGSASGLTDGNGVVVNLKSGATWQASAEL